MISAVFALHYFSSYMGNCFARFLSRHDRGLLRNILGRRYKTTLLDNEQLPDQVEIAIRDELEYISETEKPELRAAIVRPDVVPLIPTEEVVPPYCDFPFIIDQRVIEWIRRNRVLFIMRGVPGSGKSTIVKLLFSRFPQSKICSADNFWISPVDGVYRFDVKRLKDAHNWCQNEAFVALKGGLSPVVIDNTNIRSWEYRYYTDLSKKFTYLTLIVSPRTPWRFDANACALRNSHNVPFDSIEKKIKEFEPTLPLYFGWFLDQADANQLLNSMEQVYQYLLQSNDSCQIIQKTFHKTKGKHGSSHGLETWFQTANLDLLHVTAKFCLHGRAHGSRDYCSSTYVWSQQGVIHDLVIYALVVTPRTRFALVSLPQSILRPGDIYEDGGITLWQGDDKQLVYADGNPGPEGAVPRPPGIRAHITLGVSANVRPVQAGLDALQIYDALQSSGNGDGSGNWCVMTQWGLVQYLREGRFYLHLDKPIAVPSIFAPRF